MVEVNGAAPVTIPSCPLCTNASPQIFFERRGVPVHQNLACASVEEARLVPSVALALMKATPAKCTEGFQVRDYLCVEDVASAIVAVAQSKFEGGVNVGSGEPVTVRPIVQLLGEIWGRTDLIAFGAIKTNPVDLPFVLADVRRLRNEIGWRPSSSREEALHRTVRWWKENQTFCSLAGPS